MVDGSVAKGPGFPFYQFDLLLVASGVSLLFVVVVEGHVGGPVQAVLGAIMLLFVPGYALGYLLFGPRSSLPLAAEFALTVGFSVLVNGLAGLALLALHQGLNSAGIGGATLALCLVTVAVRERRGFFTAPKFSLPPRVREELGLSSLSRPQRVVAAALLVGILVATAGLFYVASLHPNEVPTARLLIGPEGAGSNPLTAPGSVGHVYSVEVQVINGGVGQNTTLTLTSTLNTSTPSGPPSLIGWKLPLHLDSNIESLEPLHLGAGETVALNVSFEFLSPGNYLVSFALLSSSGSALDSTTIPVTITG